MFQSPRIFNQLPASTLKTPPPLILWQKKFCATGELFDGRRVKTFRFNARRSPRRSLHHV
jgi:hypothetical protein